MLVFIYHFKRRMYKLILFERHKSVCSSSPLPLQVVDLVHTLWPQWGTPWGLGTVSQSARLKAGRDSCTADQGEVAALTVHDCRRTPETQQRAKELHDKETCFFCRHKTRQLLHQTASSRRTVPKKKNAQNKRMLLLLLKDLYRFLPP